MLNLRQFYHLEYSFNVLIPSSHIQCDSAWRLWRLCSSSPTVLTLGSSFLLMFSFWLTSFLLSMFQTWWAWDVFIPPHQPLSCILNLVVQQVPQRQLIDTHEPCVPPHVVSQHPRAEEPPRHRGSSFLKYRDDNPTLWAGLQPCLLQSHSHCLRSHPACGP